MSRIEKTGEEKQRKPRAKHRMVLCGYLVTKRELRRIMFGTMNN